MVFLSYQTAQNVPEIFSFSSLLKKLTHRCPKKPQLYTYCAYPLLQKYSYPCSILFSNPLSNALTRNQILVEPETKGPQNFSVLSLFNRSTIILSRSIQIVQIDDVTHIYNLLEDIDEWNLSSTTRIG